MGNGIGPDWACLSCNGRLDDNQGSSEVSLTDMKPTVLAFILVATALAQAPHTIPPRSGSESAGSRKLKLSVGSSPDGADIEVDGSFMGSTPSMIELTLGEHQIVVRKSGYRPWQRKLKLVGGDIKVSAELERDEAPQKANEKAGSNIPTPDRSSESKAENENVYYREWEAGESKSCETYSGQPYLLICDKYLDWEASFMNLIVKHAAAGMSEEQSYHMAFLDAKTHAKRFSVKFSEEPWPEPRTGRKLAVWDCTKDAVISCLLNGRQDK